MSDMSYALNINVLDPAFRKELREQLEDVLRTQLEAFRRELVWDIRSEFYQVLQSLATPGSRISVTETRPRSSQLASRPSEGPGQVEDKPRRDSTTSKASGPLIVGQTSASSHPNGLSLAERQSSEGYDGIRERTFEGKDWGGVSTASSSTPGATQLQIPIISKWMDRNWRSYKAQEFVTEIHGDTPHGQYKKDKSAEKNAPDKKQKGPKKKQSLIQRMSNWGHHDTRVYNINEDVSIKTLAVQDGLGSDSTEGNVKSAETTEVLLPPGALRSNDPTAERDPKKKTISFDPEDEVLRLSASDKAEHMPRQDGSMTVERSSEIARPVLTTTPTLMSKRSLQTAVSVAVETSMMVIKFTLRRQIGDFAIVLLLILNALWMGATNEYLSRHADDPIPLGFRVIDWSFCTIFVIELTARIYVIGIWRFWVVPDWRWNVFDAVLVAFNVVEEIVGLIVGTVEKNVVPSKLAFMRILRILRLARALRLLRVVHHVRELHTMVCSIMGAFRSFLWTLVLFVMIIYVASIYFGQLVLDYQRSDPDKFVNEPELDYYFGSTLRAFFTLYQSFTGGVDWDNAIFPIMKRISVIHGVVFSLYIAFSMLVMMNVVTAVFVDAAQKATKEDKDIELVNQVRELFVKDQPPEDLLSEDEEGGISWPEFQEQLSNPRLAEYFKAIDLDLSEAKDLFGLLDSNNTGLLTAEEFVLGCLRLTGPAKAIDLATLMKETSQMFKWLCQAICIMYDEMNAQRDREPKPLVVSDQHFYQTHVQSTASSEPGPRQADAG